jgi:hypothetical protein
MGELTIQLKRGGKEERKRRGKRRGRREGWVGEKYCINAIYEKAFFAK